MADVVNLTAEHEAFRRMVREFAEADIAPHVERWDAEHHFPVDVVHKMGELGLFGITAPAEYGGGGGDFTSLCRSEEHTSELQSRGHLVCRLLLEKKNKTKTGQ